ncbi:MAG: DUF433 domain-containing protein [Bdellovibrionota bacterium]
MKEKTEILRRPAYGIAEAAHVLGVPPSTLRYWVCGQRSHKPILNVEDPDKKALSFLDLVEAHVLSALRKTHDIPLPELRKIVQKVSKLSPKSRHPLAEHRFATQGKNVLVEETSKLLVNLSKDFQYELREIVEQYLNRIEWDEQRRFPIRLYPYAARGAPSRDRRIVVDPFVSFGRPVVVRKGVRTEVIADRFKAGEDPESLARDFGIEPEAVWDAIRYESRIGAAA